MSSVFEKGIASVKFTSKTNNNYIIIPRAGNYGSGAPDDPGNTLVDSGTHVKCESSQAANQGERYYLYVNASNSTNNMSRDFWHGLTLRPVQ